MALNIKNREVEELAAELAALTHESKTEAIRQALVERKVRLELHGQNSDRGKRAFDFLRQEVWPYLSPDVIGRPISKEEQEEILGFGPDGV